MAASSFAVGARRHASHRTAPKFLVIGRLMPNSRSVRRRKRPMTIGPNTSSGGWERDETLIKQLEAPIYSNEIWEKAP